MRCSSSCKYIFEVVKVAVKVSRKISSKLQNLDTRSTVHYRDFFISLSVILFAELSLEELKICSLSKTSGILLITFAFQSYL